MRPKKNMPTNAVDLFRSRLDQIINLKHELAQLAGKIDLKWLDEQIAPLYSETGRPAVETRFMLGLLLLKHIFGLSDEEVFQHSFPHERSGLSHWRKRLGDRLKLLLAERPAGRPWQRRTAASRAGAGHGRYDCAAQEHHLPDRRQAAAGAALNGLNRLARQRRVLHQSYLRVAKRSAMMAGRYAHAKQFNRHRRELRFLRTRLRRLIRDIRRKIAGQAGLETVFHEPLARARQIRPQQQRQRGWKLYSFHAPEVECIGKGKARTPWEFGVKASIVTTNSRAPVGQFALHAAALPGAPYDGHTLGPVIDDTERLTGRAIERAFVDKGYRGHHTTNPQRVFISEQKRGVFGTIKRQLRRRSAIEAVIGHLKNDGHLDQLLQHRQGPTR